MLTYFQYLDHDSLMTVLRAVILSENMIFP